ncbi:MAG: hypothetical protein Q7U05_05960 [Polaromonas sp.]|nr:hypothetical protein [Polaromonas sp.]
MIISESLERARSSTPRVVNKAEFVGVVTDLFVSEASSGPRPQSFLVEQSANWTLPTHFHLEHQFQVFTAGSGSLGKTPIHPLTVHYASPHSGYGPLISQSEGISYFTLRAMSDTGAWYLPEAREHLKVRIKKQQSHAEPAELIGHEALKNWSAPSQESLLELDPGGLAAWLLRLPPNTKMPAPDGQALGGGRFYVVSKGSALISQAWMPAWSTAYVTPDESVDIQSGPEGLEILVLQFPAAALVVAD